MNQISDGLDMYLTEKMLNQFDVRHQHECGDGEDNSINSTGDVCRVVDSAGLFLVKFHRNQDEDDPEQECRQHDRDKQDSHEIHRIDQDIGEYDCRYGP